MHLNNNYNRDWCNLYYLHATMFGMTSLGINITHGIAATDFVATLPGVDPGHFGVMGLSGGGTMALWMTLCDPRFQADTVVDYAKARCEKEKPFKERFFPSRALPFPNLFERP